MISQIVGLVPFEYSVTKCETPLALDCASRGVRLFRVSGSTYEYDYGLHPSSRSEMHAMIRCSA
jgi:hypothetical protein